MYLGLLHRYTMDPEATLGPPPSLLPPKQTHPPLDHLPHLLYATIPDFETFSLEGQGLPQCIAHRGSRAAAPENSLAAFRAAAHAGAHAIETDVHISHDGVVVLSHDASLKRCFGVDKLISACGWTYLSTLRAVAGSAEPEPMARLSELLDFLAGPEGCGMWSLLDVKASQVP